MPRVLLNSLAALIICASTAHGQTTDAKQAQYIELRRAGDSKDDANDPSDALQLYLKAKALDPDDPGIYIRIATTAGKLQRRDICLESIEKLAALRPDSKNDPEVIALLQKFGAAASSLFADAVVARGKGFEIKQSQIDQMYLVFKARRAAMGEAVPDDLHLQTESRILDKLVATRLFVLRATEQEKVRAKEIAAAFIAEQKKAAASEESFRRQLLAVGMTPEAFDAEVQEQAVVKVVIDREITAAKQITDAQAKKFFDDNPTLFPPNKTDYAQVKTRIKDTLLRVAVEKELPQYVEKLKKEADVQILAAH